MFFGCVTGQRDGSRPVSASARIWSMTALIGVPSTRTTSCQSCPVPFTLSPRTGHAIQRQPVIARMVGHDSKFERFSDHNFLPSS